MSLVILPAELDEIHLIEPMIRDFVATLPLDNIMTHYRAQACSMLIYRAITDQSCWVAKKDGDIIGVIGGYVENNAFCLTARELNELFWWVEPEHRDTKAGYMLYMKYKNHAQYLLDNNEIEWAHISTLEQSPESAKSLVSQHFTKADCTYTRQRGQNDG